MANPFDALRQPIVPVNPRPEFVADLRGRLLRELGVTPGGEPMTTATTANARSFMPYICVANAAEAIEFYGRAFGAVETMRVAEPNGRIGHAELDIGDVHFMLSDEYPEIGVTSPTTLGGSGFAIYLVVDDCDAMHDRAVAAGATSLRAPEDQDHGNRMATISDPYGHRWMLSQPIEEFSLATYQERAAQTGWDVTGPAEPAGRVSQLGYFTLSVPDVQRAMLFYGGLFGWRFDPPTTQDATYAHVNNTDIPFGFVDNMEQPSPMHFYRVDDIAAAVERVRELGGEVLEVTDYPSGGNAVCKDDQGVQFQLWKPAPGYE